MPIPHESWECSLCGARFNREKEAAECENRHAKITEVKPDSYTFAEDIRYPSAVIVTFADGCKKLYSK